MKHVDQPRPAFLKLRAWRRGPFMPARIYRPAAIDPDTWEAIDRYPPLQAEIGDARITDHWRLCIIWNHSTIIDEAEHAELVRQWPDVKAAKPADINWNNPEDIYAE